MLAQESFVSIGERVGTVLSNRLQHPLHLGARLVAIFHLGRAFYRGRQDRADELECDNLLRPEGSPELCDGVGNVLVGQDAACIGIFWLAKFESCDVMHRDGHRARVELRQPLKAFPGIPRLRDGQHCSNVPQHHGPGLAGDGQRDMGSIVDRHAAGAGRKLVQMHWPERGRQLRALQAMDGPAVGGFAVGVFPNVHGFVLVPVVEGAEVGASGALVLLGVEQDAGFALSVRGAQLERACQRGHSLADRFCCLALQALGLEAAGEPVDELEGQFLLREHPGNSWIVDRSRFGVVGCVVHGGTIAAARGAGVGGTTPLRGGVVPGAPLYGLQLRAEPCMKIGGFHRFPTTPDLYTASMARPKPQVESLPLLKGITFGAVFLLGGIAALWQTTGPKAKFDALAEQATSVVPPASAKDTGADSPLDRTIHTGRVSVVDGDTLEFRNDVRVRLIGVDAPESSQACELGGQSIPCGRRVAMVLADRIGERAIRCVEEGRDRYGRALAVCWDGEEDLNAWLVSEGLAMAYVAFDRRYQDLEAIARDEKRGLWAGNFEPPWEYRKKKRDER